MSSQFLITKEPKQFVKRACAVKTPLPALRGGKGALPTNTSILPRDKSPKTMGQVKAFPTLNRSGMTRTSLHKALCPQVTLFPIPKAPPPLPPGRCQDQIILSSPSGGWHPPLITIKINIAPLALTHLYSSHFQREFAIWSANNLLC